MSKIKTNYIEPRVSDSTVTIGTHDGHVRIIGKSVEIDGHPNDIQIGNLLEGYESLYVYITRDEFKRNSNKFFITDVEPADDPDSEFPAKPGDAWLNNDLENWKIYSIKNNVGAWRVPKIQSDVQKLKEDVIALEGEIESLITLDEKGSWVSTSNDPPESGKVQFSNTNFNTSPMTVKISKLDTDGTSHTFVTAGLGTWIEFVEDDQDYCLGQITAIDNDDDAFFLATFDVSVAKGDVHANSVVKIRLFEAAAPEFFAPVSLNCGSGARWQKGNLNESTLEGYRYFGIEVAGSSSSSIGLGNVLYLNKLVDSEGVLQRMDQYTPTDNSYCEVYSGNELYFKSQLKPSTYKVADRNPNHIVCDFSTNYPLVSKSGGNWSGSSTYHLILTGMKINN